MVIDPTRIESAGDHRGVLVWRLAPGTSALSSAPVGGGWSRPGWLVNIGVGRDYRRRDLDLHVAEVASDIGLVGAGVGLLTAARVDRHRRGRAGDEAGTDVVVDTTVGVSKPTWAADPSGGWNPVELGSWRSADPDDPEARDRPPTSPDDPDTIDPDTIDPDTIDPGPYHPGTINTVVQMPVRLSPAAAVNAVITVTEAKTQALIDIGIPGTGTASDAVVVLWPGDGPVESFAGPRSPWGARVAQAGHAAILAGIEASLEDDR